MSSPTLSCRDFNAVTVSDGVLHKASRERERLRDEYEWYTRLPSDLADCTPQVYGWSDDGERATMSMEFVPALNLADLFVADYEPSGWPRTLDELLELHDRMRAHAAAVSAADAVAMYVGKTFSRLTQLAEARRSWTMLLGRRSLWCNGVRLHGIELMRPAIELRARGLGRTLHGALVHGDLCLSNVLSYDGRLLTVDPRGRFGRRGTGGDPRYDIAKLRHSMVGGYDFIVADRFALHGSGDAFDLALQRNAASETLTAGFDDAIGLHGYDPAEIQFIEALLFLSMPPLHADHPARQLAMYLTGLIRLNEVLR
ncbi:hypothetical protein [Nocardia sp. NPDC020380]|uniref:hypothetical protein n=1 Tax=Nocardia sp. NPDC020380 TaxID=3364309 RepID=UPI00378B5095